MRQLTPQQPKGWFGSPAAPRFGAFVGFPHHPLEGSLKLMVDLVGKGSAAAGQSWGSSESSGKAPTSPPGCHGELGPEISFCKSHFTSRCCSKPPGQPSDSEHLRWGSLWSRLPARRRSLENSLRARPKSFADTRRAPAAFPGEPELTQHARASRCCHSRWWGHLLPPPQLRPFSRSTNAPHQLHC